MAWKFVVKNVHFVGIGGVGMSGIAEVMMNLGYHVTGSDIAESDTTRHLAEMVRRSGSATTRLTSPEPTQL